MGLIDASEFDGDPLPDIMSNEEAIEILLRIKNTYAYAGAIRGSSKTTTMLKTIMALQIAINRLKEDSPNEIDNQ